MVIGPQEQFVDQQVVLLTGNDENDHQAVVSAKLVCYETFHNAAVVECICANFGTYLLNEPQVHVGSEFLSRVIW
jgi:hypothetical protein